MTRVRRRYDVQKIKMAAVLQLKINNYILETKISFLPCFYIVTTWVLIRMCTIVTSSNMTSFVYIGDKNIICRYGLERKRNDPQQKEIVLSLLSE